MQPMGEDMEIRLAPGPELAVPPDEAIAVVEGDQGHGESSLAVLLAVCRRLGSEWNADGASGAVSLRAAVSL
jgi:hypothetical protein